MRVQFVWASSIPLATPLTPMAQRDESVSISRPLSPPLRPFLSRLLSIYSPVSPSSPSLFPLESSSPPWKVSLSPTLHPIVFFLFFLFFFFFFNPRPSIFRQHPPTTQMDPTHHSTTSHSHAHHKPNTSDLMASAKVVAEAAKSTFSHESDKIDRARVAGAASDLLDAACHYGKLEEKSFGKYVEKAEDYLHQYGSSHPSATAAGHHAPHAGAPAAAAEEAGARPHHSSAHSGGEEEHSGSGGGYGDYMKMAQGFLGSGGGTEHSGSGGGYGDYMKMAQGFLKK